MHRVTVPSRGVRRTTSVTSSACPRMPCWMIWSMPRPTKCAPGVLPEGWMSCATTPRRAMPPNPGRIRAAGGAVRGDPQGPRHPLRRHQHHPLRPAVALRRPLLRAWTGRESESSGTGSQLASDRTSCRSPLANQMRLILHTAAYWLMRTLRDAIPQPQKLASGEFSTIRLRLLKVAVRIKETASRVRLAFASPARMRHCSVAWSAGWSCARREQRGECPC